MAERTGLHQIALFARLMSFGLRAAVAVLSLFDRLRSLRVEPGISPSPCDCVVEMALAHTIENKVEAAYRRGDLFAKRRELMEAWANHIAS